MLVLPAGREFTYKPTKPGTPAVIGLYRSGRQLVVPKGAEKYGAKSADKPGTEVTVSALPQTSEALDALTRDVFLTLQAEQASQGQPPQPSQGNNP